MPEVKNTAYIFPGQGSQKVGMGHDIYNAFEPARKIFQEADKTLGISLSRICFEGPDEELRKTINAQPALVTMSLACYQAALSVAGGNITSAPLYLAGHSLGEYTALAIAGVIDYQSAIYLARERGRLMFEAGLKTPGAMAAVLGLDLSAVDSLCKETGTWLANINCPGQVVISGSQENIDKAIALAKNRGASRALPLQVSGAFHSPLMQPAADGLATVISRLSFKDPRIPIVANSSAQPLNSADAIKNELLQQLCNPVQWQPSIEYMIAHGTVRFVEIGSGSVLTGLIKRINKSVQTFNVSGNNDLNNLTG